MKLTAADVTRGLELEGWDERGLGPLARRAEALIHEKGRIGVRRLSSLLQIPVAMFREIAEPALLRAGAVQARPWGFVPAPSAGAAGIGP